uniref:Uncharacterized protein n=1 Tax=Eutreptiella gymnastica TaxID=73025 RepID=A0A7S1IVH6_9EUGL|mmetsp:Transcript_45032/g.80549  ORF Transcript_45032/g.80549 Transcript_45032/m.80549 type:complete len:147 (+) Transcript_45032:621-1061(+)
MDAEAGSLDWNPGFGWQVERSGLHPSTDNLPSSALPSGPHDQLCGGCPSSHSHCLPPYTHRLHRSGTLMGRLCVSNRWSSTLVCTSALTNATATNSSAPSVPEVAGAVYRLCTLSPSLSATAMATMKVRLRTHDDPFGICHFNLSS